ncbi:hypothetical protein [Kaarinaea lacus]
MEIFLRDQDGILEVKVNYAGGVINIKYDSKETDRTAVIHAARRVTSISEIIEGQ